MALCDDPEGHGRHLCSPHLCSPLQNMMVVLMQEAVTALQDLVSRSLSAALAKETSICANRIGASHLGNSLWTLLSGAKHVSSVWHSSFDKAHWFSPSLCVACVHDPEMSIIDASATVLPSAC